MSVVAAGTVTLQAASGIQRAPSTQVYTCSANQDNLQQCTMLSTEDVFPWGAVIFLTLLFTTLFTVTIIYAPKLLSRCFVRRDSPVVISDEDEEELADTSCYSHTSHSSQERYVQTEEDK